jgi:hypothetical protein
LQQKRRQEIADLRNGGNQRLDLAQAAIAGRGLVSFGLLFHAARRRSAESLARKASAAMHKVMCRCQPCQERASQWSRPRSSLALWKHSLMVQRRPATPASSASAAPAGAKTR